MKLPLEKEIQADIVKLLKTVGAAVYKIGTKRKKTDHQGTMQTTGIPDLVAFVKVLSPYPYTVQLWVEVKRPRAVMSAQQMTFHMHALEAGCEHVTGGVDEVLAWLKARGVVK